MFLRLSGVLPLPQYISGRVMSKASTFCIGEPEQAGDVDGMAAHALMRLHTDASGDWESPGQPSHQPPPASQVSQRPGKPKRIHEAVCNYARCITLTAVERVQRGACLKYGSSCNSNTRCLTGQYRTNAPLTCCNPAYTSLTCCSAYNTSPRHCCLYRT